MNKYNTSNPDLSELDQNLTGNDGFGSYLSKYSNSKDNPESEINKYEFKIILLGNIAVGKTSILNRFIDNSFNASYKCTLNVGISMKSITLDKKTSVNMKIWDTCGEEKYKALTRQYYRESHGIILTFDLTNLSSFQTLLNWVEDIQKYGPKDYDIILIGNKADLEEERVLKTEEIQAFADQENLQYLEVSAKNGTNILLLFEILANKIIKRYKETNENNQNQEEDNNFALNNDQRCSRAEQMLNDLKEKEKDRNRNCC